MGIKKIVVCICKHCSMQQVCSSSIPITVTSNPAASQNWKLHLPLFLFLVATLQDEYQVTKIYIYIFFLYQVDILVSEINLPLSRWYTRSRSIHCRGGRWQRASWISCPDNIFLQIMQNRQHLALEEHHSCSPYPVNPSLKLATGFI